MGHLGLFRLSLALFLGGLLLLSFPVLLLLLVHALVLLQSPGPVAGLRGGSILEEGLHFPFMGEVLFGGGTGDCGIGGVGGELRLVEVETELEEGGGGDVRLTG